MTRLLPIALFFTTLAHATPNGQITDITIYHGKALVNRQMPIKTGEQWLTFDCLSAKMEQNSLQIHAPNEVQIGEINIETLTGEEAQICQQNPKLQDIKQQLSNIQAKIQAQNTSLDYLKNFGKANQLHQNDITNTSQQIKQLVETTVLEIHALKQQQDSLQSQLSQYQDSNGNNAQSVNKIRVRVASKKPSHVNLSYLVTGANWTPQYQVALDSQKSQLTTDLQAIISQNTGENWHDVPLTLSTAQPYYQTDLPEPRPNFLTLYDSENQHRYLMAAAPATLSMEMKKSMAMEDTEDESISYQVNITNDQDLISYHLPQKITLLSNGQKITHQVDRQVSPAKVWIRAIPEQQLSAYWYAKAHGFDKHWGNGKMRLYRDGHYIGVGQFNAQAMQKTGIGFGLNQQILVKELSQDNKTDTTGLFAGKQSRKFYRHYQFENQMNQNVALEILSAVPISQDGKIQVKSQFIPKPTHQNWQEKQGVISWELPLGSKTKTDIQIQHEIQYPKDQQLEGL